MDLTSSMRLKVKRDTFFLPEQSRGVYFRNNTSSFRMEGTTIAQWVATLLPMFNGEHTLGELTAGLPSTYKNMVMEIADVLYKNGFVRDMSQERPHQLKAEALLKHASQIEFLENMIDSGAYHFQMYRQTKVLAVGSGHLFVSLVSALLESGLPAFHTFITETVPTNKNRLKELVEHAGKTDTDVKVEEISLNVEGDFSWRELVRPFDAILYVSQEEGDGKELSSLQAACKEEKKGFFPAIILKQTGMAGPIVTHDSVGSWDSARRQLHHSVLSAESGLSAFSVTAGAMLANILSFEMFKELTGVTKPEEPNQFYLLDLETLEGKWHRCLPHPSVTGKVKMKRVEDSDERLGNRSTRTEEGNLFLFFSRLTSPQSGIFHSWEEGELKQLPLAQCRVQVVDPLSEEFAELLPDIISSDLTHKEARREAGLSGIERYSAEIIKQLKPTFVAEEFGIGTGETFAECVYRGLQKWLNVEFTKHAYSQENTADSVVLDMVEDERCRYYLQALTTIAGTPKIARGKEVLGFPVIWVNSDDYWYGSIGVTLTFALRNALEQALIKYQNNTSQMEGLVVVAEKEPKKLIIPVCDRDSQFTDLQKAKEILAQNHKQLVIFELEWELFNTELAGVLGVTVREEEFG